MPLPQEASPGDSAKTGEDAGMETDAEEADEVGEEDRRTEGTLSHAKFESPFRIAHEHYTIPELSLSNEVSELTLSVQILKYLGASLLASSSKLWSWSTARKCEVLQRFVSILLHECR